MITKSEFSADYQESKIKITAKQKAALELSYALDGFMESFDGEEEGMTRREHDKVVEQMANYVKRINKLLRV